MRCLYEVLDIERDADDTTIKTAYRKAALKYHPYKNQDNPQAAEERFKEVQNAYEVLTDKHERAWYDNHRDAILHSGQRHQAGGDANWTGPKRPDDEVGIFSFFTNACYSDFGMGSNGFYAVYEGLFEALAAQELAAHNKRADRKGKPPPGPFRKFGGSEVLWSEVSAFYRDWSNFSTVRDFSWAELHNTASAPNRRVRRAMESENERARKAARREFNESVQELIQFVKKRDKRVAAHAVEEAKRRQEQEKAEKCRREAERAERLLKASQYKEAAWVQQSHAISDASEEDADDTPELYCLACEKYFKSEPALNNHERSKKHLENIAMLRRVLLDEEEEEEEATLDESPPSLPSSDEGTSIHGDEGRVEKVGDVSTSNRSQDVSEEEEEDVDLDDDAMLARLMHQQQRWQGASSSEVEDEYVDDGEEVEEAKLCSLDKKEYVKNSSPPARVSAKAKRRQRQAVASAPALVLRCTTCGEEFSSRNSLFKHISSSGHAALK